MPSLYNTDFPTQYNCLTADCVAKDVTIICQDGKFRAGRLVLAHAMPALHTVLQEQAFIDSVITIPDFKSSFIVDWLKFVHTGTCATTNIKDDLKSFFIAVGFRGLVSFSETAGQQNEFPTEVKTEVKTEEMDEVPSEIKSENTEQFPTEIKSENIDVNEVDARQVSGDMVIKAEPVDVQSVPAADLSKKKLISKKKKPTDQHVCRFCKVEYHSFVVYKKHFEKCQQKIYRCFQCRKRFSTNNKMQDHMKDHQSKGVASSAKSETKFKRKTSTDHLSTPPRKSVNSVSTPSGSRGSPDLDKRTCFNTSCQKVYHTIRAFHEHTKNFHSGSGAKKAELLCKLCSQSFKSHKEIRMHRMVEHFNQGIKCNSCEQSVLTERGLKLHKLNCPGVALVQNIGELLEVSIEEGEERHLTAIT